MIPYSIIEEVNPDHVEGSATGAINFLVFVMSALRGPGYDRWPCRSSRAEQSSPSRFSSSVASGSPRDRATP